MQFININDLNHRQYQEFINLYHKSFPLQERKPITYMKNLQRKQKMSLYAIIINSNLVGLIIFINSKYGTILDYLAIKKEYQSQGFGSQALEKVYKQYNHIIVEIERVNLKKTLTIKRKNFYLQYHFYETNIYVNFFDTEFELLSFCKDTTYENYQSILRDCFGDKVLNHLHKLS